jgi:transcription-repair coupling factor (superfamily II helicase)
MQQGPEIDLQVSAIIPEDYIGDVHTRLILYKRITNATEREELHDLQVEFIDRFGLLPPPVKRLFLITELKHVASSLGVIRIHASAEEGTIEFNEQPSIDPLILIRLIQVHSKRYKMHGPHRLRFTLDGETPEARIDEIKQLLLQLSGKK